MLVLAVNVLFCPLPLAPLHMSRWFALLHKNWNGWMCNKNATYPRVHSTKNEIKEFVRTRTLLSIVSKKNKYDWIARRSFFVSFWFRFVFDASVFDISCAIVNLAIIKSFLYTCTVFDIVCVQYIHWCSMRHAVCEFHWNFVRKNWNMKFRKVFIEVFFSFSGRVYPFGHWLTWSNATENHFADIWTSYFGSIVFIWWLWNLIIRTYRRRN